MDQQEPSRTRFVLNRIYTRQGDAGTTRLAGGSIVEKDSLRVEAYGTVDELITVLGLAVAEANGLVSTFRELLDLIRLLTGIQGELFNVGAILATEKERVKPEHASWLPDKVKEIEAVIDRYNSTLQPLKSFVLPAGNELAARLHLCRVVCRRAERRCVTLNRHEPLPEGLLAYLNRLSDLFFVLARWTNKTLGGSEVLWDPSTVYRKHSGEQ